MSSVPRGAVVAALGAAFVFAGTAAAAGRQALPLPGLISVTVSPAATLEVTGSSGSGSLGPTTVVDSRIGSLGYVVSVGSAGFDLVGPVPSSDPLTHIPAGSATVLATATSGGTPSGTGPVTLSALSPVFELTYPSAVDLLAVTSSYTLSMALSIPAAASPGLYSGTVTQSVV